MNKILLVSFLLITSSFSFITNAAHVMYVVTGSSDIMQIIDTTTDRVIGEVDELENAHGLAGNANSKYLVAGSMSNANTKKKNKSKMPAKPVGVSEAQHQAHHEADTNSKIPTVKSYVSIIDPERREVIRRIKVDGVTHHISVSPNGKTAIAVHGKNGGVSVIDLERFQVITFVKTGQVPNFAVFSSDGKYAFVSNSGSGNISMIDTNDWVVTKNIKVGLGPAHLYLDANKNILYALNVIESSISAIDLTNTNTIKTYKTGKAPHGIAMSSDGTFLFVSNKADNSLTRINVNNGNAKTIDLAPAPYHVEAIAGTQKLYVSSRKKPKIWVIDQQSLKIVNEITMGVGIAHQMVSFKH